MAGMRIVHPTLSSCVVQVPVPAKTGHGKKARGQETTLQIVLDQIGTCIVSEGVWAELDLAKAAGYDHGFMILNTVESPPPLRIGFNDVPIYMPASRQEKDALQDIAPVGVSMFVMEANRRLTLGELRREVRFDGDQNVIDLVPSIENTTTDPALDAAIDTPKEEA